MEEAEARETILKLARAQELKLVERKDLAHRPVVRECCICGTEIRECMGFVLAQDILNNQRIPRELCEVCSWKQCQRGCDEKDSLVISNISTKRL